MPYGLLTPGNCEFEVKNPFIVYILYAHNFKGKDYIYVGKSKNGIFGRPKQHKDKFRAEFCYILTQEFSGTFFNDGTIQYLKHEVNKKVDATNAFINTTENTNTGTANPSDEDDCNDYLKEAYKMLKILGLDLDSAYLDEEIDPALESETETQGAGSKHALVADEDDMKVGEFVRRNMKNLLASGYLDMQKFQTLCTIEGSKALTHRNLLLFWKIKKGQSKKDLPENDMVRYWSEVHEYRDQYFLIFSQWYNDGNARNNIPNKSEFIEWYKHL